MTNQKVTLLNAIVGSQAYGTSTPESDVDTKLIYCQHPDDLLGFNYQEFEVYDKDNSGYEIRYFMELLINKGNPTMLELLNTPDRCIIDMHPAFELIRENKEKFITKKCFASFSQYAIQQIRKSNGLNKKANFEKNKVVQKDLLDFCYVPVEGKSIPIKQWLKKEKKEQQFCGLVKLDHMHDLYALYYDYVAQYSMEGKRGYESLNYKGIIGDNSNEVRTSSVPKGEKPVTTVYVNKDGYSTACKEYNEYQQWLKNRNEQRYIEDKAHGQFINGKNMLHCRRLLDMSFEILTEKKIIVERPNPEYLLKIKRGEVNLKQLIAQAEEDIVRIEELSKNSTLPESVDMVWANELILEIRKSVKF